MVYESADNFGKVKRNQKVKRFGGLRSQPSKAQWLQTAGGHVRPSESEVRHHGQTLYLVNVAHSSSCVEDENGGMFILFQAYAPD
ncbi:hypothetical protein Tco_1058563 [Tanacetum coccineum]|uniref:Uncharacterized protein n=1 Tax=Tanacetum coccineum TaxID=301880 RepID=A0ABQ5H9I0_9ASTR